MKGEREKVDSKVEALGKRRLIASHGLTWSVHAYNYYLNICFLLKITL